MYFRFIKKIYDFVISQWPLYLLKRFLLILGFSIVPSAITVRVIYSIPIRKLMYMLYAASIFIVFVSNIAIWINFMLRYRDRTKYFLVNLFVYLVFCLMMFAAYYIVRNAVLFTSFFGGYRALEFFGFKTRHSMWILSTLSLIILVVIGFWIPEKKNKEN